MKFSSILLSFFLAQSVRAQSQNNAGAILEAVSKLPSCALKCTMDIVGTSTCQLTDVACIQNSPTILNELVVCAKSTCTIREALTARKVLAELLDEPVRDLSNVGTYVSLVVGGVALLAYILRVVSRLPWFGAIWGMDDWAITAATIVIIPLTICASLPLGLGRDMWLVPFDRITKILEIFYFEEILYLMAISLTKVSILLFYLRIFPDRRLRQAIFVTIGVTVLYMVTFSIASALQCQPVHLAWNRWDGEHEGKCSNLHAAAYAAAGINILLDLVVMFLPIREIMHLSLGLRQKFGIMVMFSLGGFTTIISALRLKYLVQFANTENVTWDYLGVAVWSVVETHTGLICACMPAIRGLQRSIRNMIWPKTPSNSQYYENSAQSGSSRSHQKKPVSHNWPSTMEKFRRNKEDFVELGEYDPSEQHTGIPKIVVQTEYSVDSTSAASPAPAVLR